MSFGPIPISSDEEFEPAFTWPAHPSEFDNILPEIEFEDFSSALTPSFTKQLYELLNKTQGRGDCADIERAIHFLLEYKDDKVAHMMSKRAFNLQETEARKRRKLADHLNGLRRRVADLELAVSRADPRGIQEANMTHWLLQIIEAKQTNCNAGESSLVPVPFTNPFRDPTKDEARDLSSYDNIFSLSEQKVNEYVRLYDCLVDGDSLTKKKRALFWAVGGSNLEVQNKRIAEARKKNRRANDGSLVPVPFINPFGYPTKDQARELSSHDAIFSLPEEKVDEYVFLYDCFVEGDSLTKKKSEIFWAVGGSSD